VTLSIVIPTYGRVAPLARLLASIAAQTVAPDEVIVVDQNAPGFLDEIIGGNVVHLRLEEPNAAAARNAGFAASTSTHVLFVDDDEILGDDFVARLLATLARHPEVRCLWPAIYSGERAPAAPANAPLVRVRRAGGGGVTFERDFFRRTGGYDETLFRFGRMSEDWELGLRMQRRGLAVWHDPSLLLRHEPAPTGGCGIRSLPYDEARKRAARAIVCICRISSGAPFRLRPRDAWPIARVALLSSLGRKGGRAAVLRRPLWHLRTILRAVRESRAWLAQHADRYEGDVDHLARPTVRSSYSRPVRIVLAIVASCMLLVPS
jgi:hypothetical protein